MNISNSECNNKTENISWNYYYSNNSEMIFKCRVDEINRVNVYYIKSFSPENHTLYKEIFFNCIYLFDQNKYPIIVILNKNNGGYADLPKLMLELISPLISISKFMATKINKYMKKRKNLFKFDNIIEIDYGENNKVNLSEPLEDLIWINEEIINHKKKLKNKRKPTDILIYTDGYSFSAASTFIKYIQYYGGGIVVGFFGNLNVNNIPFDSGQSSSSIFENETLYFQSSNAYKYLNDKYNITLVMPGNQNFFDDLNLNIPLEYLVTPVDERVEIYQHFKDINYNLFINEALKIIKRYKMKCNSNNKKLILITKKCDGKFENKYTHGGYECGDNGFWSNKCVPSYCDIEFVFNHKLKKCIKRENNKKIIIYILIIILIIFLYQLFKLRNNITTDENSEEEELIDISDKS